MAQLHLLRPRRTVGGGHEVRAGQRLRSHRTTLPARSSGTARQQRPRGRSPIGRGRALKPPPVRVRIPPSPRSAVGPIEWTGSLRQRDPRADDLDATVRPSADGAALAPGCGGHPDPGWRGRFRCTGSAPGHLVRGSSRHCRGRPVLTDQHQALRNRSAVRPFATEQRLRIGELARCTDLPRGRRRHGGDRTSTPSRRGRTYPCRGVSLRSLPTTHREPGVAISSPGHPALALTPTITRSSSTR
jgi:hypothetical protein